MLSIENVSSVYFGKAKPALSGGGGGGSFDPTQIEGYDATKQQLLMNDEGTLKWSENSSAGAPTLTTYTNNTGASITIADTSSSSLVKVYKNGILLEATQDYTISGTTLTLTTALELTDKITTEVF